ncbi:zinc-dependent peptidase [uncultured Psychroserpens sp.]|uniref:zinc-dependent peptidase n=1 Tax=uncultured Psychroserpens sp. TaxID=255436 RepID=UPI002630085A|nr:zinc-dependent peptidase [uncultured Psychroserpens sp.]
MILALTQESLTISPGARIALLSIFFVGMAAVVLSRFYKFFEQQYASKYKRPFFVHFYLTKKTLGKEELGVLKREFSFYRKLNTVEKRQFEHRIARFIDTKHFVGREHLVVTTEMKILVAATSVMLTFGFRDYQIDLVHKIIIYPGPFYSNANETYHKGELNPRLNALVISWADFLDGYDDENDNINLGIHEFTHAIHLNSLKNNDVSSIIFKTAFSELTDMLSSDEKLRQQLIASKYFRDYAFTNQFEFIAVIVETFIETPEDFKRQFPRLYLKTKAMLNFDFAGY